MITNSSLTIYHKTIDYTTKYEKWERYNYDRVWWFGGKGAGINKGYENANNVEVRIPFVDDKIISVGDILVKGTLASDIETQQDLAGYDVYNVTSININNFGNSPHIHIGGK